MKLKIPLTIGSIPIIDSMAAAAGLPSLLETQYAVRRGYYNGRRLLRQSASENADHAAAIVGEEEAAGEPTQGSIETPATSNVSRSDIPTLLITDGDNPPDYKLMSEYNWSILTWFGF